MKDFFHGWRRKVGCVALVMACTLIGFWTRSQFDADVLCWSVGHETEVVISRDGVLSWWRLATERPVPRFWNPRFVNQSRDGTHYVAIGDWFVELGAADSCSVPYWPFAMPLTLFAAFLILWKPRKQT